MRRRGFFKGLLLNKIESRKVLTENFVMRLKHFTTLTTIVLTSACSSITRPQNDTMTNLISSPKPIPFDLLDNRIFVDVTLNGQGPFKFVFDTGGSNCLTPEVARRLGLQLTPIDQATGAGEKSVKAWKTLVNTFQVGEIQLSKQEFIVLDFSPIKKAFGLPAFDGIFGYEILQRFSTKINFVDSNISFFSQKTFKEKDFSAIPFSLTSEKPVISAKINGVDAKVLIDTGDRSALTIFSNFRQHNAIKPNYEGREQKISGYGVGGPIPAIVSEVDSVELNPHIKLKNVVSRFPVTKGGFNAIENANASIGNEILRQFDVVFDYQSLTIYFRPNKFFGERTRFIPVANFTSDTIPVKSKVDIESAVREVIQPLMKRYDIPGMAIGVILKGKDNVFNFGFLSKEMSRKVDSETIFEVGSISKIMTATLAAYAMRMGRLSFDDKVSKFIPSLKNSDFDHVSILNLGTHTSGDLPLQVPQEITDVESLIQHLRKWESKLAPGTHRTYSNIGIGLMGLIAAESLGENFDVLMKELIFTKLGLQNTFLSVPGDHLKKYAQGYTEKDIPKRVNPGVFDKEAYGIRTTAKDLNRFLKANMQLIKLDPNLSQAIYETHRPYFRVEKMVQGLIWEQLPYPVSLSDLLAGNSINSRSIPIMSVESQKESMKSVWMNKTGSTGGFAAYVAFVPAKKSGIVLLANKSYPIAERVTAAYEILKNLE